MAYCSGLSGVIASLMVPDVLVRQHNITDRAVTIALDDKTAMEESRGDWPLSMDHKCFDYLQVIRTWIKLSPITFTFRHVKGHQTDKVSYNQLDWWGKRNKDVNGWAKEFLHKCTARSATNRRSHTQPILNLENGHLQRKVQNSKVSIEIHYALIYMVLVP